MTAMNIQAASRSILTCSRQTARCRTFPGQCLLPQLSNPLHRPSGARSASQIYIQNTVSTRSLRKRVWTRTRVARTIGFVATSIVALWIFGGLAIEFVDVEDDEVEQEELSTANVLAFIPYTWPKALPKQYYKGSDPEWQSFVEFAKDRKAQMRAQTRLVVRTRKHYANKEFERLIGKIDGTKGRVMLNITFPSGPPIEYEMNGVILLENGIGTAARVLTYKEFARWKRIFRPSELFRSSLEYPKFLLQVGWIRLQKAVGIAPKIPVVSPLRLIFEENGDERRTLGSEMAQESKPTPDQTRVRPLTSARQGTISLDPTTPSVIDTPSGSRGRDGAPEPAPPPPTDKNVAGLLFARKFAILSRVQEANISRRQGPRGCCRIDGLVEVMGDRVKLTVDVTGFYNPRTGAFEDVSMTLRDTKSHRQSPLGGR